MNRSSRRVDQIFDRTFGWLRQLGFTGTDDSLGNVVIAASFSTDDVVVRASYEWRDRYADITVARRWKQRVRGRARPARPEPRRNLASPLSAPDAILVGCATKEQRSCRPLPCGPTPLPGVLVRKLVAAKNAALDKRALSPTLSTTLDALALRARRGSRPPG